MLSRWYVALRQCNVPDIAEADFVTRWLIISRACIFSITLTSGLIGMLLAAELHGPFGLRELGYALMAVMGLIAAHVTNNLLNDYIDTVRGVDTVEYTRGRYTTHPMLGGLTTLKHLLVGALILTLFDIVIMCYLASQQGPMIVAFGVSGFFLSLAYTSILKRFGLGEVTVMVVWGPLMIMGVYYSITGEMNSDVWWIALPYGLMVASVLLGKHIDRIEQDRTAGISSLPVILGKKWSLLLLKSTFIIFYLLIFVLVLRGMVGAWVLLSVLGIVRLSKVWKAISKPRPETLPQNWPGEPLWYAVWSMYFHRAAGSFFVLGIIFNIITKYAFA